MTNWRYIQASVKGTSHALSGSSCQDIADSRVLTHDGDEIFIAAVADGAGSASHAEEGARIASTTALDILQEYLEKEGNISGASEDVAKVWVKQITEKISTSAEQKGVTSREFACTLLVAAVGDKDALFLHIGDGAIVVGASCIYRPVFWPKSGEYANATYFVSDENAAEHLQFKVLTEPIEDLALFSDGLQMLALQYSTKEAHNPFFEPMVMHLSNAPVGRSEPLQLALQNFLDSPPINARTDDDKTLILATRREIGHSLSTEESIAEPNDNT